MTNFVALGQRLRDAREAKELSPDDVERATRIRARFIEQMERGDYSGMTPVQAQGFLRNYARFLGIDLDLLASELTGAESKGALGRARREPQPALPPAAPARSLTPRPAARAEETARRRRGWLTSTAIVLVSGAIVVLVVLGATALLNSFSESTGEEGAAAVDLTPGLDDDAGPGQESDGDAGGEALAAGDTEATPTESSAGPITPELAYTPPGDTSTNVVVSISVTQRTWLRVTVDGEVTRQGLARPGEVWQFEGKESVGLRASNAAALALSVNNQRQGALGSRGQLFDQTFTREGLAGPPAPEPTSTGAAPDTLSSNPAPAIASPELATLVLSPALDPNAPLPSGVEEGLIAPLPSATPEPPSPEAPTPEPPTPEPPTRAPASVTPRPSATRTPAPTRTLSATSSPTASATRTPTPLPSLTLTPTVTLTATATPSPTPFLPPRITRTPTVSPK